MGRAFWTFGRDAAYFHFPPEGKWARVHSFDYDSRCVACTQELKRRYFPDDVRWKIEEGNVLDVTYLSSLEKYDIVYSWGVLHHTGNMWRVLGNIAPLVIEKGTLLISIYNDQGPASQLWKSLKKFYNRISKPMRILMILSYGAYFETRAAIIRILTWKNPLPFTYWNEVKKQRDVCLALAS